MELHEAKVVKAKNWTASFLFNVLLDQWSTRMAKGLPGAVRKHEFELNLSLGLCRRSILLMFIMDKVKDRAGSLR